MPITTPSLHYTVADLQLRSWQIMDCLADKGAAICCASQNGNKVSECDVRSFNLASAYLDMICSYTPLAPLYYAGEPIEGVNCITEEQLDTIFSWFEGYCCCKFLPKESAPQNPDGTLKIPAALPMDDDCLLALDSGALFLLDDDSGFIALDETTCLLAQNLDVWLAYVNSMNAPRF